MGLFDGNFFEDVLNGITNVILSPIAIPLGGIDLFPNDSNPTIVNVDDLDFNNPASINAFNLSSYPQLSDIEQQIATDISQGKLPSSYNTNVLEQYYSNDFNYDGQIGGLSNSSNKSINNSNYSPFFILGGLLLINSIS